MTQNRGKWHFKEWKSKNACLRTSHDFHRFGARTLVNRSSFFPGSAPEHCFLTAWDNTGRIAEESMGLGVPVMFHLHNLIKPVRECLVIRSHSQPRTITGSHLREYVAILLVASCYGNQSYIVCAGLVSHQDLKTDFKIKSPSKIIFFLTYNILEIFFRVHVACVTDRIISFSYWKHWL